MKAKTRTNVLIAIALAIAAYVVFGPTDAPTVDTARGNQLAPSARQPQAKSQPKQGAMRSLLLLAHRVSNPDGARALFATHSWYVAPPPPPAPVVAPIQNSAPPPPEAPPMPFVYMGSYAPDGAAPVFFLTRGDRVYDVRVGDVLDNTYSVDAFNGTQLLLTYKPLNIQQQLSAGNRP
jgi:hypothetical protein